MKKTKYVAAAVGLILICILFVVFQVSDAEQKPFETQTKVSQSNPKKRIDWVQPHRAQMRRPNQKLRSKAIEQEPSSVDAGNPDSEVDSTPSDRRLKSSPELEEKRPEPPDFDMPKGELIIPMQFLYLRFQGAPKGQLVGLALYLKIEDAQQRKLAFLQRTYLAQLITFLASQYLYSAFESTEGKSHFLGMVEERLRRRLAHIKIAHFGVAYFQPLP